MLDMNLPADERGMNALVNSMGAVVFALVRRLPAGDQQAFAEDLAVMAMERSDAGDTMSHTLLQGLHAAATGAIQMSKGH